MNHPFYTTFLLALIFISTIHADEVGKPIYAFEVQSLEGQDLKLADYAGKVLLINVWDTVCPPCIAEFPSFVDLFEKYQKDGLEVLGLTQALYADEAGVKKFLANYNIPYPNAIIKMDLLKQLPQGKGIPRTFIVDKEGVLRFKYIGYQEKETLEKAVLSLLEK